MFTVVVIHVGVARNILAPCPAPGKGVVMSRGILGARTLQLASFFSSIAALALSNGDIPVNPERLFEAPPPTNPQGHCPKSDAASNKRFLLLVSTIDGKISALNVGDGGHLVWSIDAGRGPLLSSSISRLEMMRNGVLMRLIPSLDGGLYQFDGDGVEALPFTADTLLSSSYKFSEDSSVVGGKESETYGVDISSGEIHYVCSVDGCNKYRRSGTDTGDVLVIQRNQKTIRAVELRSGEEKWNFSVGSHDVTFMKEKPRANIEAFHDEEGVHVESCPAGDESVFDEEVDLDVDLKVIIPTGTVLAVKKSNPSAVIWQHKFETPITRAWMFKDGEVKDVSLFDDRFVPALSDETHVPPVLYLGIHEHQLYVQPSVSLSNDVRELAGHQRGRKMPRIQWKPYLASSPSRIPALIGSKPQDDSLPPARDLSDDKAVMLWQETEYPYDNGYYLIPDVCSTHLPDAEAGNGSQEEFDSDDWFDEPVTVTLWNWWKEVVLISICTSVVVHVLLSRYLKCPPSLPEIPAKEMTVSKSNEEESEKSEQINNNELTEEATKEQYKSRYVEDFDEEMCLGKGGFGVVFQAKNRLDDCNYAIKRIALPNSEKAKEKMMREVKALAKLDNVGIVRYYQAWFESPPPGWQEERDKTSGLSGLVMPSQATLSPTPSNVDLQSLTQTRSAAPDVLSRKMDFNPLRPFGGVEDILENSYSSLKKKGSSGSFTPHLDDTENSFDESGSYSFGVGTPGTNPCLNEVEEEEESDGIQFLSSDTEGSTRLSQHSTSTVVTPFSAYGKDVEFEETNDSFNIVFEDSGCAEKSSNEDLRVEESESHGSGDGCNLRNRLNIHSSLSESETAETTHCTNSAHINITPSQHKSSTHPVRPHNLTMSRKDHENHSDQNTMVTGKLYLYIQMQLCQRESLKDWLSANTENRDMRHCLDIFDQIVCAVEYVHDSGLMHRDLKPSNIFFSMEGVVKVGDFGLVTEFQEDGSVTPGAVSEGRCFSLKHTDQVGTRLYMSPEQLEGHSYCHKIDIYSLGLILFELLHPFSTQMERVKTLLDVRRLTFPKRFMDNRPLECDFVKQLLAPDPDKRLSARDILDSPLLHGFAETRLSRNSHRNRTRTTSNGSNGSISNQASVIAEEIDKIH